MKTPRGLSAVSGQTQTPTIAANIRRRGEDDVRVSFEVPIGDPSLAGDESESLWRWPFEENRSPGAVGAGVAG